MSLVPNENGNVGAAGPRWSTEALNSTDKMKKMPGSCAVRHFLYQ